MFISWSLLIKFVIQLPKSTFCRVATAQDVTALAVKGIDLMPLHSPASSILSAVIFNALIIPALIPPVLKGVRYRAGRGPRVAQESEEAGRPPFDTSGGRLGASPNQVRASSG